MAKRKQALLLLSAASPQQAGRQRSLMTKCAASEGIEIVDEFVDVPGAASRPGLGAILMAIRDRKVQLVLIDRVKSLGDTVMEQQSVIGLLVYRGAQVMECSTGECVSQGGTPEAKLIRETAAHVEELRKQTTVGRPQEAKKSGRQSGAKPYGHFPHEAPVVDLIMSLRREKGWGVRRVANELNRRGIVNRLGGQWQPTAIQRIFDRYE
ncbi:MAG: recombinase family protein [Planctomycetaceae bacterium]|nr:recombinase family protein [Planctomycetaceae bacterium]